MKLIKIKKKKIAKNNKKSKYLNYQLKSKTFSMNNGGTRFFIFSFSDPHGLKCT